MQWLAIAAGGAVGSVLRFWVASGVNALTGRGFPWGTLTVNVLGSLLIGFLSVLLVERLNLDPLWRGALLIGLLGGFTTFSTFSLETLNLIEQGALLRAAVNAVSSVLLCLVAAWVGLILARQL